MVRIRMQPKPAGTGRVWVLVASLVLVLVMMDQARRPQNWRWMWADAGTQAGDRGQGQGEPSAVSGRIQSAYDTWFPGIDATTLQSVQDNTLRVAEHPSWFELWALLEIADSKILQTYSIGPVAYAQLFQQPEVYRGKLVNLSGTVHRAVRVSAPDNEQGIAGYWQLWLQPEHGPQSPIVIYALDLPEGFPTGETVRAEADFTAFFYKRWAYASASGVRSAPLLLAKSPAWTRPNPIPQPTYSGPSPWLLAIVAAATAAGWVYWVRNSSQTSHVNRLRRARQPPALPPLPEQELPAQTPTEDDPDTDQKQEGPP